MTVETEDEVKAAGLASNPEAQALWDAIDAEEAGTGTAAAAPAPAVADEPGTATAPAADASTGPADKADPASDPYAGLPQAVRDEIAGLKSTVDQLQVRVRGNEGQLGGLRAQMQRDLQAAVAATARAGDREPSREEIATATKSPAALAALVENYPEFGTAIKEVVDAQTAQIEGLQRALSERQPAGDSDAKAVVEKLEQKIVDLTISSRHPDWKKQVVAADFEPWVAKQPREVQALRNSNDPEDVVRLLDIKAAQAAATRQAEKSHDQALARRGAAVQRAAVIPSGRSASAIQQKDVNDMTPEELWAHLDAVEGASKK